MDQKNALRQAQEILGPLDPILKQLVASSDSELAESILAAQPEKPPLEIAQAGPLSPSERAQQDGELTFIKIFGDKPENLSIGVTDEMRAEVFPTQKRAGSPALESAIARFADSFIEKLFQKAATTSTTPLQKTKSDRPKRDFYALLADESAKMDSDPTIAQFLRAKSDGNESAQRSAARIIART